MTVTTAIFNQVARVYDTPAVQQIVYQPCQDVVVEELRRRNPKRIADIACGTGVMTARIAEELDFDTLYGFDVSSGMLAQARAKSLDVHWEIAPAEQLPLPDGSLDAIVTTSAFHFFDQPAALAEFHRVLTPGGCLAIASVNSPVPVLGTLVRGAPAFPMAREVKRMVGDAGFTVERQTGVSYRGVAPVPVSVTIASRNPD